MIEIVKYYGVLLLLVFIQRLVQWLLPVTSYNIYPDVVLIGIVYVGINRGKIEGSIAGFIIGLIIDVFSFSFLGLMALSKASAGFYAGYFMNENKIERFLSTYLFIIIVFFASFINNAIYFVVYFQGTTLPLGDIILRYVITTAIYTSFISIFVIILRKKRIFRI